MNLVTIITICVIILISILSLILFYTLYSKIKSTDKSNFNLIEFPKETNSKIQQLIKDFQLTSEKNSTQTNDYLNQVHQLVKALDEKLSPFEKVAREKNEELKLYKEGYEFTKHKALILGIIDTISFIESAKKKISSNDELTLSYFETFKDKLNIVLNNSGIEEFEPKLNTSALEDPTCEVDVNTAKTDDKSMNNKICLILKKGYKINLNNNNSKIIKKAIVQVYEHDKKN